MSAESESLAHIMYWLEMNINQGKERCDWEEQDKEVKDEWRKSAAGWIRLGEVIK